MLGIMNASIVLGQDYRAIAAAELCYSKAYLRELESSWDSS